MPRSLKKNHGYYNQLWDFLKALGDLRSMVILLENPPKNPPPIRPESLLLFYST
jgi:hypothetical protein